MTRKLDKKWGFAKVSDKWEKLKQLTLWELLLLSKALFLLPLTALGLRLLGYQTVQAVLNVRLPVNSNALDLESFFHAQKIAKIVQIAAAHGPITGVGCQVSGVGGKSA